MAYEGGRGLIEGEGEGLREKWGMEVLQGLYLINL